VLPRIPDGRCTTFGQNPIKPEDFRKKPGTVFVDSGYIWIGDFLKLIDGA
jgi:hypothetical protein